MKVRITFEAGDGVEAGFIGKTFENSGKNKKERLPCVYCRFNTECKDLINTACDQSFGCRFGAFVEVTA